MSETIATAIASGHPLVTEAAASILLAGGNAFDAVAAAGFASAVVEPALTSLGGGGFLLAVPQGQKATLYDFFVDTPGKGGMNPEKKPHFFPVTVEFPGCSQVFNIGPGSAAVPGNLKGLVDIQAKLGRLSLSRVLQPAIKYAKDGTKLNHHQAYFLSLLEPIMLFHDYGKKIFLKNGRFIKEGDLFKNPKLASFLERLATDPERTLHSFYMGEIAENIVSDMEKQGGLLTREDLSNYQIIERQPLSIGFEGYTLLTNPPPSFGGFYIAMAIEIISRCLKEGTNFGSYGHLSTLALSMKEVENYRKASSSKLKWPERQWFENGVRNVTHLSSRGTTHISICDKEGNLASMTTSNGEGSGYFAPGTGIMLNNMMGEDDLHPEGFHSSPPGLRVASMMSPSVLMEGKRARLVLGSGGSKRIRSAITQVVINTCFLRMNLKEAICSPRIHLEDGTLQVEPGFKHDVIKRLGSLFDINQWGQIDVYFGGVHGVNPYGFEAQGDPRRGGAALVLNKKEV